MGTFLSSRRVEVIVAKLRITLRIIAGQVRRTRRQQSLSLVPWAQCKFAKIRGKQPRRLAVTHRMAVAKTLAFNAPIAEVATTKEYSTPPPQPNRCRPNSCKECQSQWDWEWLPWTYYDRCILASYYTDWEYQIQSRIHRGKSGQDNCKGTIDNLPEITSWILQVSNNKANLGMLT